VGDAIHSIAEQDYPRKLIETIIVDDGSTDKTLSVVNYKVRTLNLSAKVISQNWKGMGPARNVILNNSTGKYVIWVDSDMLLSSDFVSKQVKFMEEPQDVGIAKGVTECIKQTK
jgi:glycosyltransferase involved in cell wall biosynthesis